MCENQCSVWTVKYVWIFDKEFSYTVLDIWTEMNVMNFCVRLRSCCVVRQCLFWVEMKLIYGSIIVLIGFLRWFEVLDLYHWLQAQFKLSLAIVPSILYYGNRLGVRVLKLGDLVQQKVSMSAALSWFLRVSILYGHGMFSEIFKDKFWRSTVFLERILNVGFGLGEKWEKLVQEVYLMKTATVMLRH